jgi:uncharacterized protein (DUF2252 family)
VDFQVEEAIADAIDDEEALVEAVTRFGMAYAEQTRHDHRLFVDAFRGGQIPGISSADPA